MPLDSKCAAVWIAASPRPLAVYWLQPFPQALLHRTTTIIGIDAPKSSNFLCDAQTAAEAVRQGLKQLGKSVGYNPPADLQEPR
jgi:hypothetical protein